MDIELAIQRDIQDVFHDLFHNDDNDDDTNDDDHQQPPDHPQLAPLRSAHLTKRKLKDAVASLTTDYASRLTSHRPANAPPCPKRSRFEPDLTPKSPAPTFLPFSPSAYRSRLQTFHLPTFTASLFAASDGAVFGWINRGRERLFCHECKAGWVVPDVSGLSLKAIERLKIRTHKELLDAHKAGCPWRLTQYDPSLFPCEAEAPSIDTLRSQADALSQGVVPSNLVLNHPLSSDQISTLTSTLSRFPSFSSDSDSTSYPTSLDPPGPASTSSLTSPPLGLDSSSTDVGLESTTIVTVPNPTSEHAYILSFFNWHLPSALDASSSLAPLNPSSIVGSASTILTCSTCARRLGLWSFTSSSTSFTALPPDTPLTSPPRTLDVQHEHLSTCPFRSDTSWRARITALEELNKDHRWSTKEATEEASHEAPPDGQRVEDSSARGTSASAVGVSASVTSEERRIEKTAIRALISDLLGPKPTTAQLRAIQADLKRLQTGLQSS